MAGLHSISSSAHSLAGVRSMGNKFGVSDWRNAFGSLICWVLTIPASFHDLSHIHVHHRGSQSKSGRKNGTAHDAHFPKPEAPCSIGPMLELEFFRTCIWSESRSKPFLRPKANADGSNGRWSRGHGICK